MDPDAWQIVSDWSFAGGRGGWNIIELFYIQVSILKTNNKLQQTNKCKNEQQYSGDTQPHLAQSLVWTSYSSPLCLLLNQLLQPPRGRNPLSSVDLS